jgi:two-component sensor histidine kinase
MLPISNMRSVLYATAILFACAVVGLRGAFLWIEYQNAVARAELSTRDLSLLMEEYAKRTFETSDLLLSEIVAYVRERGGVGALSETGEANRHLAELTKRSSSRDLFIIIDRDGNVVAGSSPQTSTPISFTEREWFQSHRAGAETYIGGAIMGRLVDELLYTYSRRISDFQGEFDGVAQVGLRPSFLQDLSHPEGDMENATLGIWGRDGRVIARTGLTREQINSGFAYSALFTRMENQRTGTYRETDSVDGIDRIVSFRRLEQWPIIVTASIPIPTALASWTTNLYWSAVITSIILVAFGGLTWFGIRLSRKTEEAQAQLEKLNAELGQALADKGMLLQEIHHRVKNNLQVTSSLLQMQARRFIDPNVQAAFQETQDRLRSVGLIHDLLYRKETGGTIDLRDYLSRLLDQISSTYGASARGITVNLEAEAISIDLKRAAPLALAVTEALTNAFKHAFDPGRGGAIHVCARHLNEQIEIIVRDTGKGVPTVLDERSSLGLKLIRAFATQLDGRFSLESDRGTVFRLLIPA